MVIELTEFLNAVSRATDYVEDRILNVPRYHVKRVAVLTHRLAERAGFDGETVYALTQAAVLHDCALSEYLSDELGAGSSAPQELNMSAHCWTGERILSRLPFYPLVEGAVLYHHDRADGLGAMRKKAADTPLCAQLIHGYPALCPAHPHRGQGRHRLFARYHGPGKVRAPDRLGPRRKRRRLLAGMRGAFHRLGGL